MHPRGNLTEIKLLLLLLFSRKITDRDRAFTVTGTTFNTPL